MSQFCQYEDHDESPIIGACLKIDCQYSRSYCHYCIRKHHISHIDDLKPFKQLDEWRKLQINTYQDLKIYINKNMQLSEGLSKFLLSITVNQKIDFPLESQKVMKDEINKLIQISMSKVSLIPLISKLNDDLDNLKLEINRINQIVIQSNVPQRIKCVQPKEQDKQEKAKIIFIQENQDNQEKNQQLKQYIDQLKQQENQIQDQKEQIKQKNEQIKKLTLEQEQKNKIIKELQEKIQNQYLENEQLNKQIHQIKQLGRIQGYQQLQSNQLLYFNEQDEQYQPKYRNNHQQLQQNIDSSYQKVSFSFIEGPKIIVTKNGKMACIEDCLKHDAFFSLAPLGFNYTNYNVFCKPQIPLNQNVKLAFYIKKSTILQPKLGIGSMDQSGFLELKQFYMINSGWDQNYLSINTGDTVILDIRMKEKQLIFKNQNSSQQKKIQIDTSEALYPIAILMEGDLIQLFDDY